MHVESIGKLAALAVTWDAVIAQTVALRLTKVSQPLERGQESMARSGVYDAHIGLLTSSVCVS